MGLPLPRKQETLRSMLVPQFTIRRLFWLMTVLAALFAVMAMAARGAYVARSIIGMLALVVICLACFGLTYLAASFWVRLLPKKKAEPTSPFARHALPPRHVAPENE